MQSIILGEKITMTSYELVYKLVSVTRIPSISNFIPSKQGSNQL